MKAVVRYAYGSPDALGFEEIETPTPGPDEVLIRVRAASVNPLDWHYMRGAPLFIRWTVGGFPKPKHRILGADLSGQVEGVGSNVTQFQPGDEVFGDLSGNGLSAFAEYVCVRENAPIAPKPAGITFEEAAAAPLAAVTALQGLRDKGKIRPGSEVLINGASGGVGTFAVQIAKSLGAYVSGVCSTRNLDLVRSLGADQVVDYTQEDFTKQGRSYDLILDAVGNRTAGDYIRALNPGGKCVVVGFTSVARLLRVALRGTLAATTGNKRVEIMTAKPNRGDLLFLSGLLESGEVISSIDRSYALSETDEAVRYLETGRARGKVVISA